MAKTLLLVLAVSLPAAGGPKDKVVGSGHEITESRQLAEFDAVELRIAGDLHITIGKPTPLQVEADDNIMPLITTEVVKKRLIISADKPFSTKHSPDFKITVKSLKLVRIDGAGDVTIAKLNNDTFTAEINGAGDLRLSGETDRFELSINGAGDVFAFKLAAQQADISINGAGDVRVSAAESLNIAIEGAGDVSYMGDPTVHKSILGAGDVHRVKKAPRDEED